MRRPSLAKVRTMKWMVVVVMSMLPNDVPDNVHTWELQERDFDGKFECLAFATRYEHILREAAERDYPGRTAKGVGCMMRGALGNDA